MQRRMLVGFVCAGILMAAGCASHPAQVCTNSRLVMAGPLTANVTTDMPPRRDLGPVLEMTVAGEKAAPCCPKMALVDIDGLLVDANQVGPYSQGENPLAALREKLDKVAADPHVCAVVLRINTPGGGVAATDMMWHELQLFRQQTGLPMVACLMDVATGGGYYLATTADVIYALPTTVTGGIGVILNLYSLENAMGQFNVIDQPIKSGQYIDMGTSAHFLTDETKAWFQAMADEYHQRFKWAVLSRRPNVKRDDATNFDGRVFTATQARTRGLIDQVGYLEEAIRAAQELAGKSEVSVVMLRRENDPAHSPFAITANSPPQGKWLPLSIPGLERARMPLFLYLWQAEPTLERFGGQ